MWIRLIPLSLPDRRPIKYPYIKTGMGEMVCSEMEIFIVLTGHRAGIKAHAAVFAVIEIMSFRCWKSRKASAA